MEPESEFCPPTDEADEELSLVYLDECVPYLHASTEMSFMESITI